jgi:hypothetical protein
MRLTPPSQEVELRIHPLPELGEGVAGCPGSEA